jgi:hypothetical protein
MKRVRGRDWPASGRSWEGRRRLRHGWRQELAGVAQSSATVHYFQLRGHRKKEEREATSIERIYTGGEGLAWARHGWPWGEGRRRTWLRP